MRGELSQQVVEWILASWAGHSKNPGKVYPSLEKANFTQLKDELNQAIHDAADAEVTVTNQ